MAQRKMTPRGQMTAGSSGPAIMLMPPHIRATFMPDPPLKFLPRTVSTRKTPWTGMSDYLVQFERTDAPSKQQQQQQQQTNNKTSTKQKLQRHQQELQPLIDAYRTTQIGGQVDGMNCYNTLFVGRLAYEVTERKLLREMEQFGPIKDLKLIKDDKTGKSKGYAFIEYEHEEDMKRAYRAADGMRLEGREIVVDVERGHTVPGWTPRRLGGGLGGTRLGGRDVNVTTPGRFDPSRPDANRQAPMGMGMGMGRGGGVGPPPLPPGVDRGGFGRGGYQPPPPHMRDGPYGGRGGPMDGPRGQWERGPPPPQRGYGYNDGYNDRHNKRGRSRSPERRGPSHANTRRRY